VNWFERHSDLAMVSANFRITCDATVSLPSEMTSTPVGSEILSSFDVPQSVHTDLSVAVSAMQDGHANRAQAIFQKLLDLHSANPAVINEIGQVALRFGKLDVAEILFKDATRLWPTGSSPLFNLGQVYLAARQFDQARVVFDQAHALDPENTGILNNLAAVHWELGNLDETETVARRVLELNPAFADGYNNLGNLQVVRGQFDEARAQFLKAIELNPENGEYYRNLTANYYPDLESSIVEDMIRLFDAPETSGTDRTQVAFALGAVFEHHKSFEKAFHYFECGNRTHRESYAYSLDQNEELFRRLKSLFSGDFMKKHANVGNRSKVPIFVLGMPRSGTSLVEQILASHPRVAGAGERPEFKETVLDGFNARGLNFPDDVVKFKRNDFKTLGGTYLNALRRLGFSEKHISDKMPQNFIYLGFISLMLPNARIIHINRAPMDTCVSMYTNFFTGDHLYAYDQEELGQYYRQYEDLMAHWRVVSPNPVFDLVYEDLVADPEHETRRLLDFCRLPFDEACLDFHKTKRPVHTASVSQVRKPMYKSAVERWRYYEAQLEPLQRILEAS
jgi:Flp pilus assembly protein TadD